MYYHINWIIHIMNLTNKKSKFGDSFHRMEPNQISFHWIQMKFIEYQRTKIANINFLFKWFNSGSARRALLPPLQRSRPSPFPSADFKRGIFCGYKLKQLQIFLSLIRRGPPVGSPREEHSEGRDTPHWEKRWRPHTKLRQTRRWWFWMNTDQQKWPAENVSSLFRRRWQTNNI